jgi:hypothetical protein
MVLEGPDRSAIHPALPESKDIVNDHDDIMETLKKPTGG